MISSLKFYRSLLKPEIARIYWSLPRSTPKNNLDHVHAGARWLFRAQDAFNSGGVSRSYSIAYNRYFKRQGWIACYPETTGYIIPTVFDYARAVGSEEAFERAVRMVDWECDVQMTSGAVQGGTVDDVPAPAIFNTGQVIFGWVRAFKETRKEKYLAAAVKAAGYLLSQQDRDGAWRRNLSLHAMRGLETYTYNTRTAWALMDLFESENNESYRQAAIANVEFALRQQLPNGWFKNNCLFDASQPLLHTIAYCIRGILEVGSALGEQRYVNAARKAADALIATQGEDGGLMGRFDDDWRPTVNYSCLTGDAQIAVIWGRLHQITGDARYLDSMKKANEYLKRRQLWQPDKPELHGGICGSFPIYGRYGKYEILSWAVKFFIDSLLLEMSLMTPDNNQPRFSWRSPESLASSN
jgi:rhamnogalacturonyl hydrolase YesR